MIYYLASNCWDWADEFDVCGFAIYTENQLTDLKAKLNSYFEGETELECYFGTNEAVSFTSTEELMSSVELTEITEEEKDALVRLLGWDWGTYNISYIDDYVTDCLKHKHAKGI